VKKILIQKAKTLYKVSFNIQIFMGMEQWKKNIKADDFFNKTVVKKSTPTA
jgi:hypothetical protein